MDWQVDRAHRGRERRLPRASHPLNYAQTYTLGWTVYVLGLRVEGQRMELIVELYWWVFDNSASEITY